MKKGAATFLVAEVARILRAEGVRIFNLGGVDFDNEGLVQFKTGFGARMVSLEAVRLSTVSPVKRKLRTFAKLLYSGPLGYLRGLYKYKLQETTS